MNLFKLFAYKKLENFFVLITAYAPLNNQNIKETKKQSTHLVADY